MQYWLVKSEPSAYAWETFLKDGHTSWDGVRNFQARNHLKAMQAGDYVLFYASVTGKCVQGICRVTKTAYPDPMAKEGEWVSVELKAVRSLPHPVSLDEIKKQPVLAELPLLRQSRLSVSPLKKAEYERIVKLGGV
jgi:predicted RNA-binding protein with PUA-like domain